MANVQTASAWRLKRVVRGVIEIPPWIWRSFRQSHGSGGARLTRPAGSRPEGPSMAGRFSKQSKTCQGERGAIKARTG